MYKTKERQVDVLELYVAKKKERQTPIHGIEKIKQDHERWITLDIGLSLLKDEYKDTHTSLSASYPCDDLDISFQ